ncbi:hypothetical protein DL93DRAFT_2144921 [Clavulina sp. PMI_390]|nr:hypothetical protein DL93DRAFT_2144921 [Clavulina sp. PMI_390]
MTAVSAASGLMGSDDQHSLTTFGNPFDDDEADNSSYALVSSLLSKVKNTFTSSSNPASFSTPGASNTAPSTSNSSSNVLPEPLKSPILKPVHPRVQNVRERPTAALAALRRPAPPLISMTPVTSESRSYMNEPELMSAKSVEFSPFSFLNDEGSTSIPGFPIQDDTRSVRTSNSLKRFGSASKVIRRLRGDGLSKDYWMDDALCKECYDCKSTFTTWRRKHHCRICGQIYCSRCASNIIKGARFGQEGVVRVCNICLQMLEDDTYDDDDDRQSVSSYQSGPGFTPRIESIPNSYIPHSPFSAQTLISHSYDAFNLFAIPESNASHRGRPGSAPSDGISAIMDDSSSALAPFRRNVDEDKETSPHPPADDAIEHYLSDGESKAAPVKQVPPTPQTAGHSARPSVSIAFPSVIEGKGESFIAFPGSGSPERSDSPRPMRSRVSSDIDGAPFLRSRVPSRLTMLDVGQPGWRTRRESTAYAQELNAASMFHLRTMLRQLLAKADIPRVKDWEETLMKLALRVASHLALNPRASGTSMDVRSYVKIKKIPGGAPRDSEYVDGAVITKNVAHKNMMRNIHHPRVMLVTFPFDYHRVEGQFMPFGPLLDQEKDYLHNLVARVSSLRPHIVLVEKSVSRLALDYLLKANIAVARTVKNSALQFVARATQGQVLNSMDRLLLEPQMGHCSRFRLQTFEHPLIPGRRKTYMRFEGCPPDTASTIILRGDNIEVLKRVKAVTSFMIFIVRNLKMETFLWKDTIISMPTMTREAAPLLYYQSPEGLEQADADDPDSSFQSNASASTLHMSRVSESSFSGLDTHPSSDSMSRELSSRIQESIAPYLTNFISASATLRFPPPQAIWRMKELDDKVQVLTKEWEDAETAAILHGEMSVAASLASSRRSSLVPPSIMAVSESSLSASSASLEPASSRSSIMGDADVEEGGEDGPNTPLARVVSLPAVDPPPTAPAPVEESYTNLKRTTSYTASISGASYLAYTPNSLLSPREMTFDSPSLPGLKDTSSIARESALFEARFEHAEQRRIWEWYLRKNADDFSAQKYQRIYVRQFLIPNLAMSLEPSCQMPKLTLIHYYGENDCTLGQFIDDSVSEAIDTHRMCGGRGCTKPLGAHSKIYVHNESRVVIATEPWTAASGHEASLLNADKIASFSVCRVCLQTTPFIPISEEALKYSFGKFLELHFYPADVQLIHGAGCEHNIYIHHIRYFAWRGMVVRFQTDPIHAFEVVLPPMRTIVHMEMSLELKNRDYESLMGRNTAYWKSVVDRINQLHIALRTLESPGEKPGMTIEDAGNDLLTKAEADRQAISRAIQRAYADSRPIDTLALGAVRSTIQNKVVEWDLKLEQFEKMFGARNRLMSERDLRRITGSHHFKRIYDDFFRQGTSSASEIDEKSDYPADDPDSAMVSEPESMDEKRPLPAYSPSDGTLSTLPTVVESLPPSESSEDPDTDSTISAHARPSVSEEVPSAPTALDSIVIPTTDEPALITTEESEENASATLTPIKPNPPQIPFQRSESRLPRWQGHKNSVADLVKRFQEHENLPGSMAFPSEAGPSSSVDSDAPKPTLPEPRRRTRSTRSRVPKEAPPASDNESSYVANIGPRHLTNRRPSGSRQATTTATTRIPTPKTQLPVRELKKTLRPHSPAFERPRVAPKAKEDEEIPGPPPLRPKGKGPARAMPSYSRPPPRAGMHKPNMRHPSFATASKVSTLTRQYERIAKDTERANRRYAAMKGRKARPVASARAKVEVFSDIKDMRDAVMDDESSDSSSEADDEDEGEGDDDADQLTSSDPKIDEPNPPAPIVDQADPVPLGDEVDPPAHSISVGVIPATPDPVPLELPPSPTSAPADAVSVKSKTSTSSDRSGDEPLPVYPDSMSATESTSSMIGTVSNWWRSAHTAIPLQYPFSSAEHVFAENTITVREDEPTSIISFTLNSKDHRQAISRSKPRTSTSESGEAFMPDDSSDTRSTWGLINMDDAPNPTELIKQSNTNITHLSFQFESGGVTISCVVFCADQFDLLRKSCRCEHTVIESLARCVKWDASGGKSGSAFLKTRDDRFIAKEVSKSELDSMLNFAPAYFDYMSNAITSKRPTLLAKIFGLYKIAYKHPILGKTVRMNLLLMENLFYGRRFTRIYDLKGSMRNRHVESTGRPNEVLLDENLVKSAHLNPFYVREHSKRIIRGAIWNDTQFLAKFNIMDYSLLVAVGSGKDDLVVGIVDYIRTYTWDKRLETWVKESAFLGGGSQRAPTIVTPKQYKARFRAAMERYLPLVPDRWTKIEDAPDNEGDALLEMWPDW